MTQFYLRWWPTNQTEQTQEVALKTGLQGIGRDPKNCVCLEWDGASRIHANLMVSENKVRLEDNKSKNGIYVGSKRCQVIDLQPGDQFQIGPFQFKLSRTSFRSETVVWKPDPAQMPDLGPGKQSKQVLPGRPQRDITAAPTGEPLPAQAEQGGPVTEPLRTVEEMGSPPTQPLTTVGAAAVRQSQRNQEKPPEKARVGSKTHLDEVGPPPTQPLPVFGEGNTPITQPPRTVDEGPGTVVTEPLRSVDGPAVPDTQPLKTVDPPPARTEAPPSLQVGPDAKSARKDGPVLLLRHLEEKSEAKPVLLKHNPFRIGRVSGNDLVLANTQISRHHLEIIWDDSGAIMRDLASHNGTILNGVPIAESELNHGDVIQLGPYELRYEAPPGKAERAGALPPPLPPPKMNDPPMPPEGWEEFWEKELKKPPAAEDGDSGPDPQSHCPHCRKPYLPHAAFCGHCGIVKNTPRQFEACPNCKGAVRVTDPYCGWCGLSLSPGGPG